MAVVIEFNIPAESFQLGNLTRGESNVRVQLEGFVPVEPDRVPYFWATGADFDTFDRDLQDNTTVTRFESLSQVGESVLYFVEWRRQGDSFVDGISEVNGTILSAHGRTNWSFTVRFRNHGDLTRFHQFYQDNDFPLHVDRVYSQADSSRIDYGFGLTPEQRETLTMAVERGYFGVPRETKLDDIADELGITRQAASERLRRGAETVLRKSLIGVVAGNFRQTGE